MQLRCVVPPGTGRPPYISWKRDGLPLPATAVIRRDVLQLTNVQLSDQGRYICEARTSEGYASDYINLRVDRKYLHYHCLCGNLRLLKHTKTVTCDRVFDGEVRCRAKSVVRRCCLSTDFFHEGNVISEHPYGNVYIFFIVLRFHPQSLYTYLSWITCVQLNLYTVFLLPRVP